MTRDRARQLLAREHGQQTVDQLIRELRLDEVFGIAPGTRFGPPG